MLFHVNTILADFCWCSMYTRCTNCATKTYVQPVCYSNCHYSITQILANKIVITTSFFTGTSEIWD